MHKNGSYDYETLNELIQAFIDTIRNSGGFNIDRLLLISGMISDLEFTSISKYKIPIDPSNKTAISIKYFYPDEFTLKDDPQNYYPSVETWGSDTDYNSMITYFNMMKNNFTDKGIPVIISEIGVFTEGNKEMKSIREYLYSVFAMTSYYDGIMICLWDTSNKNYGDMNYYNRENNTWFDEKIKNNFKKLSKGKYEKPNDYFIMTNTLNVSSLNYDGELFMTFGKKKPLKVIVKVRYNGILYEDIDFTLFTCYQNGSYMEIFFKERESKKQYDGSYIFTIDVKGKDYNDFFQILIWEGYDDITFYYLTVEFEENFLSFDYNAYKNAISESI